ncbi:ClpP/crotonase-like domain-containing protein [Thamnidium elegans]|nr:ClpP/crotonase-like domain-containing protein [Thamnidium elegans]
MEMVDIIYPNLKGTGRALCAGGDVKDVVNSLKDPSKHKDLEHQIDTEYDMIHFMGTMKTPYIAVMDGITMGAGGGLCSFAPFRIATENTQFAMPENAIGLFCDVGASFFLSRLDGHLGAYMGATSRIVKGEDALFAGLATHFVPSSRLEALEARLAELDHATHDMIHQAIEEFAVERDHTPATYTLHGKDRKMMDDCFKHEKMEDVMLALKEDGSQFSKDTIDTILKRSPTSVKITHEHIRKGSGLSLKECLNMEHRLWQTVPFSHDFIEGVTSHVVNKKQPKWNPARLEDLDLEQDIRVRFFHANVKRRLHFTHTPDFHLHPFRRYALPTEKEILETKKANSLRTVADTVEWFDKDRNGKFGVRQKVEDVLERNLL